MLSNEYYCEECDLEFEVNELAITTNFVQFCPYCSSSNIIVAEEDIE